ncbi:MAG: YeeE/YedE family protein [SAR324 cluster bacterium]|uniref:YeeE/YedE family protein n=1 Tax=SAR324 cluster bacterium TaxID=2024889 RepID=A0A7X9FT96_9DELT|nr:YeeE/YedE family protein [SAR324 cluster bacterium]
MNLPITGSPSLILAVVFGAIFGVLLHRGRVTDYNVIVNMFRLKDFTVLRVMLTAIIVGGVGVYFLNQMGLAQYHIKPMYLGGVVIGAALFGIGMVLYGYCPGTGVAAIGTGSLHALVGGIGMLVGGMLYAVSFSWIQENILRPYDYGKIRLPELTGIPDLVYFLVLLLVALMLFRYLDSREAS